MKKKLCTFFILFVMFGLMCNYYAASAGNIGQSVIAYGLADEKSEIITVTNSEQLADTLEMYFDDMVEEFELSVAGSLDIERELDTMILYIVDSIEWSYYESVYSSGEKAPQSFVTYNFFVKYRDDVKALRAYNDRGFEERLTQREAALLSRAIDVIEDLVYPGMNDYEKVLAVHDYLVSTGKYDVRMYESEIPKSSYKAEGILLNGVGVCGSYASSMNLLLNIAGVECIFITGDVLKDGVREPHAWNKVKIDGNWYNADATWNDPVPDVAGKVSYVYLNVTDEFLARDHIWDRNAYPQKADSTEYNYYIYNGLSASGYEQFKSAVLGAIEKQSEKKQITLHIYMQNYDAGALDFDFAFEAYQKLSRILYTEPLETEGEMVLELFFD